MRKNILFWIGLFFVTACVAPGAIWYVVQTGASFIEPDLRSKIEAVLTETGAEMRRAENAVRVYRRAIADRRQEVITLQHQREDLLERLTASRSGAEIESDRLANIRAYIHENKPIPSPTGNGNLCQDGISEQIAIAGAKLSGHRSAVNGLENQLRSVDERLREYRMELVQSEGRVIQLESGLNLLKQDYAFHANRLREIDQHGTPNDLKQFYRDAVLALEIAQSRFQNLVPSGGSTVAQVSFFDHDKEQSGVTQNLQAIDKLLGDVSAPPAVYPASNDNSEI